MFEIYGWARIADSLTTNQTPIELLDELQKQIDDMRREGWVVGRLDRNLNDSIHALTIVGSRNHRYAAVVDLFRWIAENAPGSYGLLYVWDDEDNRNDYNNCFRVWRLARGRLEEMDDPFLSPRIPVIETSYDPTLED